jgi:hypothetical protein
MRLVKLLIITFFSSFIIFTCIYAAEKTSVPADSRYEIITSNLAVKGTFKLDKFTGDVFQLFENDDKSPYWKKMERRNHPRDVLVKNNRVNYQIVTSDLAMKCTYLVNINTGATWVLTESSYTNPFWDPMNH